MISRIRNILQCNIPVFALLFTISLFLSRCKSDCTTDAIEKDFNHLNFSTIMPYNGNEKYSYLKNNKDTVVISCSGISDSYKIITKPTADPNCEQRIKINSRKVTFLSAGADFTFFIHYFTSDELTDKVNFQLNNASDLGTYIAVSGGGGKELNVLGVTYAGLAFLGNDSKDSIYFNAKFVRIKYNSDIYEILP